MNTRPHRTVLAVVVVATLTGCATTESGGWLLGTLERDRVELVASAAEPLFELSVRPGDDVTRGQVLGRLDDRRVAARVDAARAEVRRTKARIEELERGARTERRDEVMARIEADRAELAQAELDRKRAEDLVASGVTSQSELDLARTRVDTARAQLERDRAELDEMVAGATAEELRQARADHDQAVAEVQDLEVALERLTLRSPVEGRVDAVPYEVGELPQAGATLVVLLADAEPYARVHVPEPELSSWTRGTVALVEADGLDAALTGCVRFVAREASFTPHYALSEHDRHRLSFVAEVDLDPEDTSKLPTGLPVRVRLQPDPARCEP